MPKKHDVQPTYVDMLETDTSLETSQNGENEYTKMRYEQRSQIGLERDEDDGRNMRDGNRQESTTLFDWWCCREWPRCSLVIMGVLMPIWTLVFISLAIGLYISRAEAPGEVTSNDLVLAGQNHATAYGWIVSNFTRAIPQLCFEEYLKQRDATDSMIDNDISLAFFDDVSLRSEHLYNIFAAGEFDNINGTELLDFMKKCGDRAAPIANRLFDRARSQHDAASGKLTFNWIRCYPGASGLSDLTNYSYQPRVRNMMEDIHPAAQKAFYKSVWEEDRDALYYTFLAENLQKNMTEAEARSDAYFKAIDHATGRHGCGFNSPAAAWFWFTIMTTVGYGNQSVVTTEGRTVVYVLGFVSILFFAINLAVAGRIISAIFDDTLIRLKWSVYSRQWLSCMVWGFLYLIWMLVIAAETTAWKQTRLDGSFKLVDGFWFAYISTTTIGLGDYYFEPELILTGDLFWQPCVFLVGFTFMSAYLNNLVDLVNTLSRGGNKRNLIEIMLGRLKKIAPVAEEVSTVVSEEHKEVVDDTQEPENDESEPKNVEKQSPYAVFLKFLIFTLFLEKIAGLIAKLLGKEPNISLIEPARDGWKDTPRRDERPKRDRQRVERFEMENTEVQFTAPR